MKQYGVAGCHSQWQHFKWVLDRQLKVTIRNKLFVTARLGAAVMTSLVLGSVWYQLPKEQGFEKLGMLLFCILHISFSNFSELTFSVEQKYVAYKHVDGRGFHADLPDEVAEAKLCEWARYEQLSTLDQALFL